MYHVFKLQFIVYFVTLLRHFWFSSLIMCAGVPSGGQHIETSVCLHPDQEEALWE